MVILRIHHLVQVLAQHLEHRRRLLRRVALGRGLVIVLGAQRGQAHEPRALRARRVFGRVTVVVVGATCHECRGSGSGSLVTVVGGAQLRGRLHAKVAVKQLGRVRVVGRSVGRSVAVFVQYWRRGRRAWAGVRGDALAEPTVELVEVRRRVYREVVAGGGEGVAQGREKVRGRAVDERCDAAAEISRIS